MLYLAPYVASGIVALFGVGLRYIVSKGLEPIPEGTYQRVNKGTDPTVQWGKRLESNHSIINPNQKKN